MRRHIGIICAVLLKPGAGDYQDAVTLHLGARTVDLAELVRPDEVAAVVDEVRQAAARLILQMNHFMSITFRWGRAQSCKLHLKQVVACDGMFRRCVH